MMDGTQPLQQYMSIAALVAAIDAESWCEPSDML